MKKGFTLMELLIVMVIVSLLVTMVLPKYKAAMEKGRGLEGLANVAAVSDAVNAYYVRNGNSYGDSNELKKFVSGDDGVAAVTKNMNFQAPEIFWDSTNEIVTVSATRATSKNPYTITFVNTDGEVSSRTCSGNEKYCQGIGAVCSEGTCTL